MNESKKPDVLKVYDSDESPLAYMIEPRGSVTFVDEDHVSKKEDFENIL